MNEVMFDGRVPIDWSLSHNKVMLETHKTRLPKLFYLLGIIFAWDGMQEYHELLTNID